MGTDRSGRIWSWTSHSVLPVLWLGRWGGWERQSCSELNETVDLGMSPSYGD